MKKLEMSIINKIKEQRNEIKLCEYFNVNSIHNVIITEKSFIFYFKIDLEDYRKVYDTLQGISSFCISNKKYVNKVEVFCNINNFL